MKRFIQIQKAEKLPIKNPHQVVRDAFRMMFECTIELRQDPYNRIDNDIWYS
ncbi:hypothetical protein [Prevotella histicola]|jgi:hypothetical protein|uniref:hypothetical protein n=1 Tax=Prevotella histicola TaxID=470565 RepID=UPI0028F10E9C|nr:hypothetical protein [Prevotella histicola]